MRSNLLTIAFVAGLTVGGYLYWKKKRGTTAAAKPLRMAGPLDGINGLFSNLPGGLGRTLSRVAGTATDPAVIGGAVAGGAALAGAAGGIASLFNSGSSGPRASGSTASPGDGVTSPEDAGAASLDGVPNDASIASDGVALTDNSSLTEDAQSQAATTSAEFPQDNAVGVDAATNLQDAPVTADDSYDG